MPTKKTSAPADLFLGLDIGGTKSTALLGDASGNILRRSEFPSLAHRGPEPMLADLIAHAKKLLAAAPQLAGFCPTQGEISAPQLEISAHKASISRKQAAISAKQARISGHKQPQVRAAGVSIGGPLDAQNGLVLGPPNLPGWTRIPLKQILERELKMPVAVEHDAAACALAEYTWGAGQAAQRLIYLTCGTGFGAGFIIDGKIYRGAHGSTMEIGHVRYRDDGPTAYGKAGSIEAFAAAGALARLAAWRFPKRWKKSPITSQDLGKLAAQGDPDALQVIDMNALSVGQTCALLGDLLRPDVIVLGSLAQYLGPPWLARVQSVYASEVLEPNCRIVPAGLGKRLQDCSALVVALSISC